MLEIVKGRKTKDEVVSETVKMYEDVFTIVSRLILCSVGLDLVFLIKNNN
jgi:3-hydroxyacyl-CoA dehydrogenase